MNKFKCQIYSRFKANNMQYRCVLKAYGSNVMTVDSKPLGLSLNRCACSSKVIYPMSMVVDNA